MEAKLNERISDDNRYKERTFGDFKTDYGDHGIFDKLGLKDTSSLTWDDDEDIKSKYNRMLENICFFSIFFNVTLFFMKSNNSGKSIFFISLEYILVNLLVSWNPHILFISLFRTKVYEGFSLIKPR